MSRCAVSCDAFVSFAYFDDVNLPSKSFSSLIKAGIAHLWFVTIHPFDDRNGRIARAIADLCLARSEKRSGKGWFSTLNGRP